ncbi:NIPSNAP protein [Terriglobus roseus]|uniref:NIPSNAP protein n=2 Tax=Terriglobus roseus TaxID=392734 RepID=A0A1H4RUJ3_9BACT|nr:NIPSNAP protein [Terriglobus roseus]
MDRRKFMATAAASLPAMAMVEGQGMAQAPAAPREFYQLRRYELRNGPQTTMVQNYFAHALIPALNRMGIDRVGTFKIDIGPETPTYYALIPSTSAEMLLTLDMRLPDYAEFSKAAAEFWAAPATATAFQRSEVSMMGAFNGFPKLIAPKPTKRIFQLRTYESPSYAAHAKKVGMFEGGEIAIFQKSGLTPVFFGHNLAGTRLPSLTYMLTFPDLPTLSANWSVFGSSPEWKEISHRPGLSDADIVNNITNLYLSPLASSQI